MTPWSEQSSRKIVEPSLLGGVRPFILPTIISVEKKLPEMLHEGQDVAP